MRVVVVGFRLDNQSFANQSFAPSVRIFGPQATLSLTTFMRLRIWLVLHELSWVRGRRGGGFTGERIMVSGTVSGTARPVLCPGIRPA
ncbi:hypothetical protein J2R99_001997 [Rhodopseudomonas julia]|uniref:Uncharacterized protein n=1 Tax=Rhodopseudomonas julia TaxID=200617 RepID=A0ABU0C6I7_9BRAD|nr:hypothetical protein [Rhodopseudomonas julia]